MLSASKPMLKIVYSSARLRACIARGFFCVIVVSAFAFSTLIAGNTEEKLRRFSEKLQKVSDVLKILKGVDIKPEVETSTPVGPAKIYTPDPAAEFTFEPHGITGKALFASFIISTATVEAKPTSEDLTVYGDEQGAGYAGVLLHNVHKGDKFVVEVSCDGLIKPSRCTFTAKDSEVVVLANPKLKFDFAALSQLSQTRPVIMTFKVIRNGVELDEVTQTWQLHQMNDCIYGLKLAVPRRDGVVAVKFRDARFMFAAYVNENHPLVDEILKDAKATGLCNSFLGYQAGEAEVAQQINAVWTALQARGITYSSITNTTTAKDIYLQHVRFFEQSIKSTQANCVDGSVLMASVLKKIGLKTYLVLVPGHCYLAVYTQEPSKGGSLLGIETTMLGSGATIYDASEAATISSATSLKTNQRKFKVKGSGYLLVDIEAAREIGIMPLPYNK
jgi:hypothetical protein